MLLRGGLTVGKLVHSASGGPLFGPALVEAHKLESRAAIYPRIIVDQKIIDLWDVGRIRTEETHYLAAVVGRDFDGLRFLDYIDQHRLHALEGKQAPKALRLLTSVGELLKEHLLCRDPGIRAKYGWLARHYGSACEHWLQERAGDSPSGHSVSEEVLDGFRSLPTFSF